MSDASWFFSFPQTSAQMGRHERMRTKRTARMRQTKLDLLSLQVCPIRAIQGIVGIVFVLIRDIRRRWSTRTRSAHHHFQYLAVLAEEVVSFENLRHNDNRHSNTPAWLFFRNAEHLHTRNTHLLPRQRPRDANHVHQVPLDNANVLEVATLRHDRRRLWNHRLRRSSVEQVAAR